MIFSCEAEQAKALARIDFRIAVSEKPGTCADETQMLSGIHEGLDGPLWLRALGQIASYLYPSTEGSRALEQGGSRSLGRCSSGSWRSRHRCVNSKVPR